MPEWKTYGGKIKVMERRRGTYHILVNKEEVAEVQTVKHLGTMFSENRHEGEVETELELKQE